METSAELSHAKETVADFYRLRFATLCALTIRLRLCRLENFIIPSSIPGICSIGTTAPSSAVEHQYVKDSNDEEEWFGALEQQP